MQYFARMKSTPKELISLYSMVEPIFSINDYSLPTKSLSKKASDQLSIVPNMYRSSQYWNTFASKYSLRNHAFSIEFKDKTTDATISYFTGSINFYQKNIALPRWKIVPRDTRKKLLAETFAENIGSPESVAFIGHHELNIHWNRFESDRVEQRGLWYVSGTRFSERHLRFMNLFDPWNFYRGDTRRFR